MERFVYADNAATTRTDPRVTEAMLPFFSESYGNPSSQYLMGQRAKAALEDARRVAARFLGAQRQEIFFTSGGTESDAWAILSTAAARARLGKKTVICSAVEHPAVLNSCRYLESQGFALRLLPVDNRGLASVKDAEALIGDDVALVSVMAVNNEVGTIQPIEEIGALCRANKVPFHCDAVQAAGKLPLDMERLPVDLLSVSAHKLRGPKGVGLLYVRGGEPAPLLHGGGQERGKRPGTENLPCVVGMAKALQLAEEEGEQHRQTVKKLDCLLAEGLSALGCGLHGDGPQRLPGLVNACFPGVSAEALLLALDLRGIAASAGSACSSGSVEPSHVLLAMGVSPRQAKSSLRFSLGGENTEEDVRFILQSLSEILEGLRRLKNP